jgi:hypothetical protein
MKFGQLKSLGHNIADSLGSGIGLMIGIYEMDIYAEASANEEGFIAVNFLDGTVSGSPLSAGLRAAIGLYRDALPGFCEKHGIAFSDIRTLTARYGTDRIYGPHFLVCVESADGRKAADQYAGIPGRRVHCNRI